MAHFCKKLQADCRRGWMLALTAMLIVFAPAAFAQSAPTVTGTVTDQSGQPVIGATIIEQGTTNGATTGVDGSYSLKLRGGGNSANLIFQSLGFVSQTVAVNGRTKIDVKLAEDAVALDAVVAIGYGTVNLEKLGIQCQVFSPVQPFVSTHYNYRDHRKILVIDGKVGFTGGVNLADEYINHIEKYGRWKDAAVMLEGEAVRPLTILFLEMWSILREPEFEKFLSVPPHSVPAKGFAAPYGDCPLDGERVGEMVYIDLLNRAKRYIHIMTPYLILDGELETALKFAAERGVDVHLILPHVPDKKFAYALAKTHYKSLLDSGVKISEWLPGFVHAKVFVVDDSEAVVGTINLDYRSLYHHFENAVWMKDTACIPAIEKDFQKTLEFCRDVEPTRESIWEGNVLLHLAGILLKVIAPLL